MIARRPMDGALHLSGPWDQGLAGGRSRARWLPTPVPDRTSGTGPASRTTVALVVPTRNEAAHVDPFIERVEAALAPFLIDWHAEVIDDSEDETPALLRGLA